MPKKKRILPIGKKAAEHEAMKHAREDAKMAMKLAKEKFQEAEGHVEEAIKDDPVRAAMIASGIGAVLGAAVAVAVTRKKKSA